ncbi:type II secretion system protein [Vibrio lentus]|nr:type II secretion system protein [Vibrio lentus]
MRTQRGFTILELITCLVILGSFHTAMVKFLDAQGNARASKIHDVAGNLRTGIHDSR